MLSFLTPPLWHSSFSPLRNTTSTTSTNLLCRPSPNIQSLQQTARLNTDSRKPPENPSYPAFKFSNLGANRAVKITVYTVIGILGTLETIFWTKAALRYFKSSEPIQNKQGGDDTGAERPEV